MQEREYESLVEQAQKWDEFFERQNIGADVEEREFIVLTEMGADIRRSNLSLEAIQFATEEMNERQKTAVYNLPGDATSLLLGVALGDVDIRSGGGVPVAGTQTQTPASWATPMTPWGDIYSPFPRVSQYQHGGFTDWPAGEARPAILHGQEHVLPSGQSPVSNITTHSYLYVDGKRMAVGTSRYHGDMLYQANRASYGTSGALISV